MRYAIRQSKLTHGLLPDLFIKLLYTTPEFGCCHASSSRCYPKDWAKIKHLRHPAKARAADALDRAVIRAIAAITPQNPTPWFRHCGYGTQQLWNRSTMPISSGLSSRAESP